MDTLSKQRYTSAPTFTAIELKAVIALGPFEEVTADQLNLLKERFEDICGLPFERAEESTLVFCDRNNDNVAFASKLRSVVKESKKSDKQAEKQAKAAKKHADNLARGEAARLQAKERAQK
ncbi:unnamed protein product [Sympodiomycopsis kandeliae]